MVILVRNRYDEEPLSPPVLPQEESVRVEATPVEETPVKEAPSTQSNLDEQRAQAKKDYRQMLETKRPVIREAREDFGGEYHGGYTPAPPPERR